MKKHDSRKKWVLFLGGVIICSAFLGFFFCINKDDQMDVLNIVLQKNAENCQDIYRVEDELNRYLADIEDFQVQFKVVDEAEREKEYLNYLRSKEEVDLIFGDKKSMTEAVSQGLLEPLDELMGIFGQDTKEILSADYLNTGSIEGISYGIPSIRDYASSACFEYNVELAEKYDLQMESVQTLDDLEIQLTKIKNADSSIIPVGINHYVAVDSLLKVDCLGDALDVPVAVLCNYGKDSKVVNFYETQEFADFSRKMYAWRKKGLLMDETGASISAINYLKSGKVLGCFSHYHPGFEIEETRGSGIEIGCVVLNEAYITSFSSNRLFWEIPSKSEKKEMAMRFLNLMYTDQKVVQILTYGLEDIHYEYKDEEQKIIGYPEGIDVNNSRYAQFLGWIYGNEMLLPVWEGLSEDYWAELKNYNDTAVRSSAMGFCFDERIVETEITQCRAVAEKYYRGLINGELDPEKYLPIMQEQLKTAGIDRVISEKQKQLNQYLEKQEYRS